MKAVLFGSTGNVTRPLTAKLVKAGVETIVITRSEAKVAEISAAGATPAVGDIDDKAFLLETLKGANVVFVISALPFTVPNIVEKSTEQMANVAEVILEAGVPNVVYLSALGAHKPGLGGLEFHYNNEQLFRKKFINLNSVVFVRPAKFYSNLIMNLSDVKKGTVYSFLDPEKVHSYVSLEDIAEVIADVIENPPTDEKFKVINVESDRITIPELTALFATTFNQPDLKWVLVSIDDAADAMEKMGCDRGTVVSILTSLTPPLHDDIHEELFSDNIPVVHGTHKLPEYVRDVLLPIYNSM